MSRSSSSYFELQAESAAKEIGSIVDRVLLKEFLKNELKLAYIRSLVLLVSTTLDGLVFCFPQALIGKTSVPATIFLIGLLANVVSLMILGILRRQQQQQWLRSLRIAIPLFDGLLLAAFITNIAQVFGSSDPYIVSNIAAFCSLLAVSGGIRLYQWAAVLTSGLALVNFIYAARLFSLPPAFALFAAITILGTGILSLWIASIVQRQVKNEAGRLVMERFLPKSIVEAAFESPSDLLQAPKICSVTVMVTDLRGFTHYSEKLAPEEVLAFLNQVQGWQTQIVEQQGGVVDKFMGDGMLAVFGAPEAMEDHAQKALQVAQRLLREVEQISPLPMGIGLHSGLVVAGCLGMGNHLEFTIIGDTVNVASRIEALTKQMGCPLLVSETTQQQLGSVELRSLGPKIMRGREEALELFTLPQFIMEAR